MDVKGNEFDTAMIGQVVKHEMGYAIGLSDATSMVSSSMTERVNDGGGNYFPNVTYVTTVANYWKLGYNSEDNTVPAYPEYNNITC